jgi:hypothetical protein
MIVCNSSSGRYQIIKNEEGRIFIDRDGKFFDYILEYLRDGEWNLPPDVELQRKIRKEINYYGFEDPLEKIEREMNHKVKFMGFAFWDQDAYKQSDEEQDRLMHEAANKTFPGSKAATAHQYKHKLILSLPTTNTSGSDVSFTAPGNIGLIYFKYITNLNEGCVDNACVSGHRLIGVAREGKLDGTFMCDNLVKYQRAVLCVMKVDDEKESSS